MRHCSKIKKLSLKRDQRQALLKSLAEALIFKEKIKTSQAKARALKPFFEKLVTRAKKQDLSGLRFLRRTLSQTAVNKLRLLTRQRFGTRQGGYLRMVKLPRRPRDNAALVVISFSE